MGGQQNPMMNVGGAQMPLNQVNPSDLRSDPQALYAYQQMMAKKQIGKSNAGYSNLSPQVQQWQQAILAKYFPNLRF